MQSPEQPFAAQHSAAPSSRQSLRKLKFDMLKPHLVPSMIPASSIQSLYISNVISNPRQIPLERQRLVSIQLKRTVTSA